MSKLMEKLDGARFAFKDESFCVDGPLNRQRERLHMLLVNVMQTVGHKQEGGDQRISDAPVRDVKRQIDELEDKMRDKLVVIRFTAMNRGRWEKQIMQNPPRRNNQLDSSYGFNTDTFFKKVIQDEGVAMFVEEEGTEALNFEDAALAPISVAEWARLDEVMTAGDWDRICMTLLALNQKDGQSGADFLRTGSQPTTDSETTSDSPVTSE